MRKILVLSLTLLVASCATVRPHNASNYDQDLTAPQETDDFRLTNKEQFDEPMLGVMLEYANKWYPTDNIDLYIYPINSFTWKDTAEVLETEINSIVAEVDNAVKHGYYNARGQEEITAFNITRGEEELLGRKASFDLISRDGIKYYSNAYIFIDKDKFIKFRTSFDSRATVKWNGDAAVKEILPLVNVPDESDYMRNLRQQHKEQMANDFMNLLLQAVKESKAQEKSN